MGKGRIAARAGPHRGPGWHGRTRGGGHGAGENANRNSGLPDKLDQRIIERRIAGRFVSFFTGWYPIMNRWIAAVFSLIIIVAGVGSRLLGAGWPLLVTKHLGDVLWAAMFYFLLLIWRPGTRPPIAALAAFAAATGAEALKLCHAPWLDRLREERIPGFILGRDFHAENLIAYALGAAAAALVHRWADVLRSRPYR